MDKSKLGAEVRRGQSYSKQQGEKEQRFQCQNACCDACVCVHACVYLSVQNHEISIQDAFSAVIFYQLELVAAGNPIIPNMMSCGKMLFSIRNYGDILIYNL